jgi:hypothetical protein
MALDQVVQPDWMGVALQQQELALVGEQEFLVEPDCVGFWLTGSPPPGPA